jgi:hypothetical protein
MHSHIKATLLLIVLISVAAHSQGIISTAAEFLLIAPSPETNAQGTSSVSRITDDAYAVHFNPAQLGFSSTQTNATFACYPSQIRWKPDYALDDLTYNSYVLSGGINLEKYCCLPISVGVAYSHIVLDYGIMSRTLENSPEIIGTFDSEEHANAYSVGVGIDLGVRLALGFTLRKIESNLNSFTAENEQGSGSASLWSHDYGLLMDFPITNWVAKNSKVLPDITPLCDVSFGTALTNVGDKMAYIDPAQAEPLSRTMTVGLTAELGLVYAPTHHKLVAFTWSRESSSLLVGVDSLGISYYRGGFGDIDFFKNVIGGKQTNQLYNGASYAVTDLAQGWQLGIGEMIYIRGGSFEGAGNVSYSTHGLGFRASGLLKLVKDLSPEENPTIEYLLDHFDIRYDQSDNNVIGSVLNDTKFSSLSIIVKM